MQIAAVGIASATAPPPEKVGLVLDAQVPLAVPADPAEAARGPAAHAGRRVWEGPGVVVVVVVVDGDNTGLRRG